MLDHKQHRTKGEKMVKTFPIYLFRIFFLRKNMFLKRKTRLIKGERSKFPSVSLPVDDGKTTEKKRETCRVCVHRYSWLRFMDVERHHLPSLVRHIFPNCLPTCELCNCLKEKRSSSYPCKLGWQGEEKTRKSQMMVAIKNVHWCIIKGAVG